MRIYKTNRKQGSLFKVIRSMPRGVEFSPIDLDGARDRSLSFGCSIRRLLKTGELQRLRRGVYVRI